MVRINLGATGLTDHDTGGPVADALAPHRGGRAPAVIMIHGFKFDPGTDSCPHDHILSLTAPIQCWKAKSWPAGLGISDTSDTLGIAFGWSARGTIWQAYDQAYQAGVALAKVIRALRAACPARPVHILAHSLGARVALSALPHLPAGAVDRAVLLAGAEFCTPAEAALASPAGQTCEVISITSRENRLYERLMALVLGRPDSGGAIGQDAPVAPGWLTLPIDDMAVLDRLAALGHHIAPPQHRICHWSSYLRPGVFSLYAALVSDPTPQPIAQLRRLVEIPSPVSSPVPPLATTPVTPRWRTALSQIALPLPGLGRAAG